MSATFKVAGEGTRVEMITPKDLKVDPQTQRTFNPTHAGNIARNFDPTLIGLIEVSQRSEGFFVIDGQHRRAAAINAGRGDVPIACHIVEGLTLADEGRRFVGINSTVKKPSAIDVFRIRVTAEDPAAVEIQQILDAAGLRVAQSGDPGTVAAVTALEWVYFGRGGVKPGIPSPEILIDTLAVLASAWGKDRDAYDASILKAVGIVIGRHGDKLDRDRLVHTLAKSGTPAQLIGRAKSLGDAIRKSIPVAGVQVIADIYNHNLRKGRLEVK